MEVRDTGAGSGVAPAASASPPGRASFGPSDHGRWIRCAAVAIVLAVVVARVAGAGWVYDDHHMVDNPAMDGTDDILAVFSQSSAAYLSEATGGAPTHTYRPLTMLTLVAPHVLSPTPTMHHLVSWLLHVVVCLLLFSYGRRRASLWTIAVALFALHPALVEAWVYINGRSDLVAGLCLAGLWRSLAARGRRAGWFAFALALLGVLSKETFLLAAPFVLAGRLLVRRGGGRPVAWGAIGLSLGCAVALTLGPAAGGGALERLLSPRMIARWPALLGLASESLLLPFPRAMRSLAHELGPGAGAHVLAAVVFPLAALLLALRHRRAALHLLGAAACLLPTVLVSDLYWLGFDRYLYLPALLLLTGGARELRARRVTRPIAIGATAVAVLLAASSWAAAGAFEGPDAFAAAVRRDRPADPAGYLLVASRQLTAGDIDAARATMAALPPAQLTGATGHEAARVFQRLGRPDLVIASLEAGLANDPDNPYLGLDLLGLRASQRRYGDALRHARSVRAVPGFCPAVRESLQPWEALPFDDSIRSEVERLRRPCP